MTPAPKNVGVFALRLANGISVRARDDKAWREEYRERVEALAEAGAARALEGVVDPEAASALEDLLLSRVKALEAAGLARAGFYLRASIEDALRLALQVSIRLL